MQQRRCELCGGQAVPTERFCQRHVLLLARLHSECVFDLFDFELDLLSS
jgi:hypothetical protein